MDKLLKYAPEGLEHYDYICGVDEVGRGCLAGPLVTAGVILPKDFKCELIKDSKKLTEKKRKEAYNIIIENAISYSIKSASVKEINKYGINPATFISMHRNIEEIEETHVIQHLLVDGTQWEDYNKLPHTLVIKGDNTYLSIAAASILAKVKRDEYMIKLSEYYPGYNFEGSKGYRCKKHDEKLLNSGPTKYHRQLFTETRLKNLNKKF